MRLGVVGTGYVGLVTGTCFAEMGNDVTCVDVDSEKIGLLQAGRMPIYEPDLESLFSRNLKEGRLRFSTELSDAVAESEVVFLALPTPANDDGSVDLSRVLSVAERIAPLLRDGAVVIDKSTVPVGTARLVKERISERTDAEFDVVSNPEFLREGLAVSDFMKPDRVVIGTSSERAMGILRMLYKPFVRQGNPLYFMDEASAEMTKYAANGFLATKISFMNEIANLCERVGADVDSVRLGIGADERIGKRFLFAGIGYGGSCFPKDVKGLKVIARQHDYEFEIIGAVDRVNDRQKARILAKMLDYYKGEVRGKRFALWGLSFKPDTDDIREAPALDLIEGLTSLGAQICAYDPQAMDNVKSLLATNALLSLGVDAYSVLDDADALIIATEWSVFRTPDLARIGSMLRQRVVFDGRNVFELSEMRRENFHYESIGRPTVDYVS